MGVEEGAGLREVGQPVAAELVLSAENEKVFYSVRNRDEVRHR